MNREKLLEAIVERFLSHQRGTILAMLKPLSDTNLIAFALQMGIDTDSLLSEGACL